MARPPSEIRAERRGERFRVSYAEEGRWHIAPAEENTRSKALAWARRNRSRFLDSASTLTLRPFLKGFFDEGSEWCLEMEEKKHVVGEKSRREYAAIVRNHIAPLFGDRDPRELSAKEITAGLRGREGKYGRSLASATKYRIVYVLSLVLGSLAESKVIQVNPLVGVQPYSKAPEQRRGALPRETLDALFPAGHGPLMRVWKKTLWTACMCVAHDTGSRPIELVNIKWGDIHEKEGAVIVRRPKRGRRTKDGEAVGVIRAAHLSERTLAELKIWKAETPYSTPSDWVFTLDGTKPVTGAAIVAAFRSGLRTVGVDTDEGEGASWTTYWLRHSFVTYALADLTPGEVAELAGHSVAIAEGTYSHPDDRVILERTRAARKKLDAAGKGRGHESSGE